MKRVILVSCILLTILCLPVHAKVMEVKSFISSVRQRPNVNSGVIGVVKEGQKYELLSNTKGGWVKLKLKNGTIGWVNKETFNPSTIRYDNTKFKFRSDSWGVVVKDGTSAKFNFNTNIFQLKVIKSGKEKDKWDNIRVYRDNVQLNRNTDYVIEIKVISSEDANIGCVVHAKKDDLDSYLNFSYPHILLHAGENVKNIEFFSEKGGLTTLSFLFGNVPESSYIVIQSISIRENIEKMKLRAEEKRKKLEAERKRKEEEARRKVEEERVKKKMIRIKAMFAKLDRIELQRVLKTIDTQNISKKEKIAIKQELIKEIDNRLAEENKEQQQHFDNLMEVIKDKQK